MPAIGNQALGQLHCLIFVMADITCNQISARVKGREGKKLIGNPQEQPT